MSENMKRVGVLFPPEMLERVTDARVQYQTFADYVREAVEAKLSPVVEVKPEPAIPVREVPPGAVVVKFSHDDLDVLEQASAFADQTLEDIVALGAAKFARKFVEAQLSSDD